MINKLSGLLFIVGIILGVGAGYKLFNKPPTLVEKTEEKKEGVIVKYRPAVCSDNPQIESIESYSSQAKTESKPEEKHNAISYIPKYSFGDSKIYHAAAYSYDSFGVYVAENKEIGAVFTFRW